MAIGHPEVSAFSKLIEISDASLAQIRREPNRICEPDFRQVYMVLSDLAQPLKNPGGGLRFGCHGAVALRWTSGTRRASPLRRAGFLVLKTGRWLIPRRFDETLPRCLAAGFRFFPFMSWCPPLPAGRDGWARPAGARSQRRSTTRNATPCSRGPRRRRLNFK
jgi:hypothetical protein